MKETKEFASDLAFIAGEKAPVPAPRLRWKTKEVGG